MTTLKDIWPGKGGGGGAPWYPPLGETLMCDKILCLCCRRGTPFCWNPTHASNTFRPKHGCTWRKVCIQGSYPIVYAVVLHSTTLSMSTWIEWVDFLLCTYRWFFLTELAVWEIMLSQHLIVFTSACLHVYTVIQDSECDASVEHGLSGEHSSLPAF